MANIDEEEVEFKKALANLQLEQSRFCRKINDLKALRHSIRDGVAKHQVLQKDYNKLNAGLETLESLQQEYETNVDAFNTKFGWKQYQEAIEVNKAVEANLNSGRNIKVNVEILMRKVNSQLVGEEVKEDSDDHSHESEEEEFEQESGQEIQKDKEIDKGDGNKVSNDNKNHPEENGTEKTMSIKMRVAIGLITVLVFYSCLGGIIKLVQDNKDRSKGLTTRSNVQGDKTACGADSFMLRDGVCDETSNIAKCLYDGGDCCKENKDESLCLDCTCRLEVNIAELEKQFNALEIHPIEDMESLQVATVGSCGWTIEVKEVLNMSVCSVPCLEHEEADEVNAWHYQGGICRCGWIESKYCPENMVNKNWTTGIENGGFLDHMAYVQLNKTVGCDCLTTGLRLHSNMSELAQVDYGNNDLPSVHSLWHCRQLCQRYKDCAWVSWRVANINDPENGQCQMMKILPANVQILAFTEVDQEWISSSMNCSTISDNFEKHLIGRHYHFICPKTTTTKQVHPNFIIYIDGWSQSAIVVLKVDHDNLVECAHSILPPENRQMDAAGGVLKASNSDDPVVVICGGDLHYLDSNMIEFNKMCSILYEDKPSSSIGFQAHTISADGVLNQIRKETAALVIDNGSTLWIIGGYDGYDFLGSSEFVSISEDNLGFPTNGVGPDLPNFSVVDHCLVKIGPDLAVINGGQGSRGDSDEDKTRSSTWSINLRQMVWREQARNDGGNRISHHCGVLANGDSKIIIIAGGKPASGEILKRVDTLLVTVKNGQEYSFADHWKPGPSLPEPMQEGASVTTEDQHFFFIIGGKMTDDVGRSVFKLSCTDIVELQCVWKKLDYELKVPSMWGLALTMPDAPMVTRRFEDKNCSDLKNSDSLLMLTTGWNENIELGDTEAFVLSSRSADNEQSLSRCQPFIQQTQSMFALSYATGGVLETKGSGDVIVVCGGQFKHETNYKCYHISKENSYLPSVVGLLQEKRLYAASTVVLNGSALWVTGGYSDGNPSKTTELITASMVLDSINDEDKTLSTGIPLPEPLMGHCLENINSKTAILYGGNMLKEDGASVFVKYAWTINNIDKMPSEENDYWTRIEPMAFFHHFHSCGVIRADIGNSSSSRKFVVAAGGNAGEKNVVDTVELLPVDETGDVSGKWFLGPRLPTKLTRASSATTKDKDILFVAGGWINFFSEDNITRSYVIYSLKCIGFCFWTIEEPELTFERVSSVALVIPPAIQDTTEYVQVLCKESHVGDGVCDAFNNNARCGFDGGDCCLGEETKCSECQGIWCKCHTTGEQSCDGLCLTDFVGDGYCDGANNVEMCQFDDGDCCQTQDTHDCKYCLGEECTCHETGSVHCIPLPEECVENGIQDGWCDGFNNVEVCGYDGGDCCLTEDSKLCLFCEGDECICIETGHVNCKQTGCQDGLYNWNGEELPCFTPNDCIFPWKYDDNSFMQFDGCAIPDPNDDDFGPWCPTVLDSNGFYAKGSGDFLYCTHVCDMCVSSWYFNGQGPFYGCANPDQSSDGNWCVTKVDNEGNYVSGHWRWCFGETCVD